MPWKFGSWNKSSDGSAMKVSEKSGVTKTERISSTSKPHSHDVVKSNRYTGRVTQIQVGEKAKRK